MIKPRIILPIAALLLCIFMSCQKQKNQNVTVIKNCTGTYLRWQQKDYKVCNLSKVASFANGSNATATFTKMNQCNGEASEAIVCMMVYESEGWIKVHTLK